MKLLTRYALAILALLMSGSPLAAQSVWNVTTGNWSVAGNWNPSGVPVSDPALHLRFNATAAYTSTNNLGALTLNRLTVNNTSTTNAILTLAASSTANTLTFDGVDPTLDITGTVRLTGAMAGSATITKTGPGKFIQDSNSSGFTGTIIIDQGVFASWGGTSTSTAQTTNFNPVSIVVNNGGTYQFGNASIGTPNLALTTYITVNEGGTVSWEEGKTLGGFNLWGGTISLITGTATANGTTAQSWTHGSITGNVYTASSYNMAGSAPIFKTTAGTVTMSGAVALTNTGGLRLQEGTVVMTHAMNLGTAPLTFGGEGTTGTLEYQGATAARAGNLIRSAGGTGVIDVTQASTILTLSGANTGSGMLSKTGPGTLYLSGSFAATGITQVAEGTLKVNPVTASGGFYVEPGSVLAVNSGNSSSSFSLPTLAMNDTATLLLELGRDTVPGQALVQVRNTNGFLFMEGAVLRVTNTLPFANGTYTLVDYAGTAITGGLTLQLPGRTLGSLVYDEADTRIQMDITGTDSVKWSGAVDGAWDAGTAAGVGGTDNWQLVTGGTATNFIQTDTVLFDDSAVRFDVQIQGALSPFSVKVDASTDYTFSGEGKITGSTGLSKSGTGTLILATDNDYTGGTFVTGGTLQLGNGGSSGSVTGPLTLANSTLAFNHAEPFFFDNTMTLTGSNTLVQNGAGTVTMNSRLVLGANTLTFDGTGTLDLAGAITGSGVINKNGTGHLTLLGLNTFSGTLNINAGTVQLTDKGSSGDINAVSIMVNDGGTFIFGGDGNPDLPAATIITVNMGGLFELRTGETYGGMVLNGGDYLVTTASGSLASNGETTVPGTMVFDLRSGTMTTQISGTGTGGALGQSGGGVAAKTTSGTVTMGVGMTFNANLALQVREGTLAMPTTSVPATGTAIVSGGVLAGIEFGTADTQGTLQVYGGGIGSTSRNITVQAGGGRIDVVEAGTILNFNGGISGDGPLIKTGAGTLNLSGALGSTGLTTVSEGTLRLKPGSMAGGLAAENGSLLAVGYDAVAATLNVPAVMLASGSVLQYEFSSSTLPVLPLVNVTGADALTSGGAVLLRLTNSQHFATGLYTLLDYSGSAITSGYTLELEGRATGTLIYDTAGTKITASIIQGEEVRWTGATNGQWDAGTGVNVGGTQNWQTITSLAATNFVQADFVHFDDSASRFDVSLEGALRPNALTVNAASDYTFSGSGKISGITALSKSGSGALILATDNDYTGGTTVSGGLLQLGNGGSSGSITGPLVLSGGSLGFNRSDDYTLTNAITLSASIGIVQNGSGLATITSPLALGSNVLTITGSGDLRLSGVISGTATQPLIMNGSGILYLPATNTFAGTTVINSGTVSVSTTRGLGATTAGVIINGGTLQLTAATLGTVSSTGRIITIGPAGGTLDFHTNQTFSGNGFFGSGDVVKTGPGRWSVGANASTFSGAILIAEGSLLMTSAQLNLAQNLTVADGAQFIINDDTAGTWSMVVGGKYIFNGDGGGEGALRQVNLSATTQGNVFTTTFNRELVLASDTLVSTEVSTGTISVTSNITGAGMLTKQGPGTLRLAATGNSYAGGTLITGGTLLAANTTGSATGTGAVTIGSGARLMGTGFISGNVTLQSGALIQGGLPTAAGTLTLAGETLMESGSEAVFRLTADGINDLLVFETLTLESNATLRILLNYAAEEGHSFNLLDWTTLGTGNHGSWVDNLDLSQAILADGLKWDTSLFNSDGILMVSIIPEPSRLLLLAGGLGCLLMRRRRRD